MNNWMKRYLEQEQGTVETEFDMDMVDALEDDGLVGVIESDMGYGDSWYITAAGRAALAAPEKPAYEVGEILIDGDGMGCQYRETYPDGRILTVRPDGTAHTWQPEAIRRGHPVSPEPPSPALVNEDGAETALNIIRARMQKRAGGKPLTAVIDHIITECAVEGVELANAKGRAILRDLLWEATDTAEEAHRALVEAARAVVGGWIRMDEEAYTVTIGIDLNNALAEALANVTEHTREK